MNNLIKKVSMLFQSINDMDERWLIETSLKSFSQYVHEIADIKIEISAMKNMGLDKREFKTCIEYLNFKKQTGYNVCVSSINILNRMAKKFNLSNVFDGDVENSEEVEDFALLVTSEYFGEKIED